MRVLITRAEPAATRSAARLRQRGHEPIVAPLLRIVASGQPMPDARVDAMVLTSANALVAMPFPPAQLPVLAVGAATAAAARAVGFAEVHSAGADRRALARLARDILPPGSRLLLVAARDRKEDTAALLIAAGHHPLLWTAYAAQARGSLPEAARRALAHGPLDAVLHYSRRSASILLALAGAAGLAGGLLRLRNVCLSSDVSECLRAAGAECLNVALRPDEESLFNCLDAGDCRKPARAEAAPSAKNGATGEDAVGGRGR